MSLGTKKKKGHYAKHFLLGFFFLRDFDYLDQFVTTYFHSSEIYKQPNSSERMRSYSCGISE